MNRKSVFPLAAFICLALAASSFAQSKFSYVISTGASNPTAPDNFDTNWKTGYNIGFEADYAISENLQISPSLQFSRFGIDLQNEFAPYLDHFHSLALPIPTIDYGDANAVTLMLNVKHSPLEHQLVTPYVVGGIGLLRMWMEEDFKDYDFLTKPLKNQTSFLLNGGLGFRITMSQKFSFFVEGTYVTAFTDRNNTNYLPFKTGIIIK